jgi:hypothetical protein
MEADRPGRARARDGVWAPAGVAAVRAAQVADPARAVNPGWARAAAAWAAAWGAGAVAAKAVAAAAPEDMGRNNTPPEAAGGMQCQVEIERVRSVGGP